MYQRFTYLEASPCSKQTPASRDSLILTSSMCATFLRFLLVWNLTLRGLFETHLKQILLKAIYIKESMYRNSIQCFYQSLNLRKDKNGTKALTWVFSTECSILTNLLRESRFTEMYRGSDPYLPHCFKKHISYSFSKRGMKPIFSVPKVQHCHAKQRNSTIMLSCSNFKRQLLSHMQLTSASTTKLNVHEKQFKRRRFHCPVFNV